MAEEAATSVHGPTYDQNLSFVEATTGSGTDFGTTNPIATATIFLCEKLEYADKLMARGLKLPRILINRLYSRPLGIRVECKKCGKYSWGGCGDHLTTLYASIDKGKHCFCKSWPGVVIPSESEDKHSGSSSSTTQAKTTS